MCFKKELLNIQKQGVPACRDKLSEKKTGLAKQRTLAET